MKKIIFNVIAFAFAAVSLSSCGYNSMVEKQEAVDEKWSQVQNVYQRRADLIPNLVAVVKGYAKHESQTLENVIAARARATQVTLDPDKLTPENIQKFQQAQDGLSTALGKLLMITENYPDLKANQNFLELQAQLEGTENRIAVERRSFNEAVKDYNTYIRKFPNNLTAGMFGFEKKAYFESQAGADKAPKIEF
ncbi:MAG: LemA family protein [Chitinophagaceae bacterium]|nr:LemA family protein [Chitinophagaceae bacterium]